MTKFKVGDRIVDHCISHDMASNTFVCLDSKGTITSFSQNGAIHYKSDCAKNGIAHPKQCELIEDVPFKRGLDDLLSVKPRPPECPKEENADNSESTPSDNQLKAGMIVSVFDQAEHYIARVDEFWEDGTVIVERCVPRKNTKDVVAVHPMQCRAWKWDLKDSEESEENKDHIPDAGKKVEWCDCIGALVFNIKTKIHETCGKPIKHIRDLGAILNNLASGTTSINEIKTKESHARVDNVLRDGKIFQQGRRIEELGNIAESHKSCLHDSLKRFVALEEKYNAIDQEVKKIKAAREVDRADNEGDSMRVVTADLLANQKIIDTELLSLKRAFDKINNRPAKNNDDIQDRINQLEHFKKFVQYSWPKVNRLDVECESIAKQVNDHDNLINGMRRELDSIRERRISADQKQATKDPFYGAI